MNENSKMNSKIKENSKFEKYTLSVLNDKYYKKYESLFNNSINKYVLINKNILFNYLSGKFCEEPYNYDFNQSTFSNVIYRDVEKRYNLYINYIGFDFKYLIVNNLINKFGLNNKNSKILLITNISTILYNFNTFYNERKMNYHVDVLLSYNSEFSEFELNKKLNNQYPVLSSFKNILSSHRLNEYIKFIDDIKYNRNEYFNTNIHFSYNPWIKFYITRPEEFTYSDISEVVETLKSYLKSFGLVIQPEFTWQRPDEYEPSIHRGGVMNPMTFELDSVISKCEIHFVLSK